MKYIYELPIYDGALKNWRILNLNTGTFYSMSFDTEQKAKEAIEDGSKRAGNFVLRISHKEISNHLDYIA